MLRSESVWSGSGEGPVLWYKLWFPNASYKEDGELQHSLRSVIRALIPFIGAPYSQSNYFPNAPFSIPYFVAGMSIYEYRWERNLSHCVHHVSLTNPNRGGMGLKSCSRKLGGRAVIQLSPNQSPQLSYTLNSINTRYSC